MTRAMGMGLWHCRIAAMYAAAYVWRGLLFRTTFIAITGSMGKTTAKECLAAILSARAPTVSSQANQNDYSGVPRSLLRVRPWHRFAVIEVAANGLGLMRRSSRLVRPDIAIVLLVARNHMKNFRTLEKVAAEKALLLARLRPGGTAILNGDDPRVAAMAQSLQRKVVWFGTAPSLDYRAEAVSSNWPRRLSFELSAGAERKTVQTRLVGGHWKSPLLASVAAANVCGVSLDDAIRAVGEIEPIPARMQPIRLSTGAIVVRDELDGSIGALASAFAAFEAATADRKILVLSGVTDSTLGPRDRYRKLGRDVARIFGIAVFIGGDSAHGVNGAIAAGMRTESAHGFASFAQALDFLGTELRTGDLVLLKGRATDHLTRLAYALVGPIQCRLPRCEKRIVCDLCPELGALTPLKPEPEPSLHTAARWQHSPTAEVEPGKPPPSPSRC